MIWSQDQDLQTIFFSAGWLSTIGFSQSQNLGTWSTGVPKPTGFVASTHKLASGNAGVAKPVGRTGVPKPVAVSYSNLKLVPRSIGSKKRGTVQTLAWGGGAAATAEAVMRTCT